MYIRSLHFLICLFCCCYLLGFASQWHKIKMCSFVTPLASGCHHISENYFYKPIGRSKTNACFLTHTFLCFSLKSIFLIQNTKILPSKASITRKSLPFLNYFVKNPKLSSSPIQSLHTFHKLCVYLFAWMCSCFHQTKTFCLLSFCSLPFSIVLIHRYYKTLIELTSFSPYHLLLET